jgi:hypothetical protein
LIECFIGYTDKHSLYELKATLEFWDAMGDVIPIAIRCRQSRYEMDRRVAAENVAKGDYILCDLNYGPEDGNTVSTALSLLRNKRKKVGMVLVNPGIRLCRKGAIARWPQKSTSDYNEEHRQAFEFAGYSVVVSKLKGKQLILPC